MKKLFYLMLWIVALAVPFGLLAQEVNAAVGGEQTELPTTLTIILAWFAPLIWQFVTKHIRHEWLKFATTIALSVVTGFVALLLAGQSLADFGIDTLDSVGFWSAVAYKLVWKPLLFNRVAALKAVPTRY